MIIYLSLVLTLAKGSMTTGTFLYFFLGTVNEFYEDDYSLDIIYFNENIKSQPIQFYYPIPLLL